MSNTFYFNQEKSMRVVFIVFALLACVLNPSSVFAKNSKSSNSNTNSVPNSANQDELPDEYYDNPDELKPVDSIAIVPKDGTKKIVKAKQYRVEQTIKKPVPHNTFIPVSSSAPFTPADPVVEVPKPAKNMPVVPPTQLKHAATNLDTPVESSQQYAGYVEAGGNYHSLTDHFGHWSGQYLKGEVQTDSNNRWNAETINQREFDSRGLYGAIGNTHVFNEDWYSSVTVGAGGNATFLPRYRADGFLNRKWLDRKQLITTFGLGADEFRDGHKDQSVFLGATYYLPIPWIVQGGVRVNNSTPGDVHSTSEFVAVTQGEDKHHFITARYGFGKEAYQIIGPGNAISDFSSQQFSLELRQWLEDDWGFDVRGERYHNPNYDRTGINLGVFKEF